MHPPAKEKQKEKTTHLEVTSFLSRPEIYNDDGKTVILRLLRKLTEKSDMT